VLYLDEPTANLDVHSAAIVYRVLRELVGAGSAVLLTTHNMREVEEICDRVGILCRGRLVALDTPLALRRRHAVHRAEVVLSGGRRAEFDLDQEQQRAELAQHVASGAVASIQTREFDFQDVFLKLTGTPFT
jgi:ABC-2 type transport system ATP-binding protein